MPPPRAPAFRRGAARDDAVPRIETVRLTAPDLKRRAAMAKTRRRLGFTAIGFGVLFVAVMLKLADATIIQPLQPHRPERPIAQLLDPPKTAGSVSPARRATITDRNGEILAISLPTAALYANPRELIDPADAAHKLKSVLPKLDEEEAAKRLAESGKQFVYLARQLSPREQLMINALGIPGIYFEPTERRRYPMGRAAAQVLGGVDVDGHGVAGVERFFDQRLHDDPTPLRLSIDVRVQAVVRDELSQAMDEFRAIGACGIVMDVRTGEVLAMVSLPDYDANMVGSASPDERFNRAVTGMYEPGSTFKLQTAAMALDGGIAHIWDEFDASRPIRIGRFTITDFEGKHRWLYLPEVLAYSSNLGAAHIAQAVGAERQRAWLRGMGMFNRIGIELPEVGLPIVQPASNWKEVTTLTVGFGHGIAVSPLHVVRGTAVLANGGIMLQPTILAKSLQGGGHLDAMPANPTQPLPPPPGERILQQSTSDTIRKLMRLVVTDGYGKTAEIPGYYVGGKTGTAEKVGAHGYRKHTNVAAFMSVFPMNQPRYAVYMMLDEPHANASTHGYATAGWVAAPAAGRVIARIGPMLGLLPDIADADAIKQALYIPLQPGRPPGAPRTPPVAAATPEARPAATGQRAQRPGQPIPANGPMTPVLRPAPRDQRHQAQAEPPAAPPTAAVLVPALATR
ncbi:MAG: penicillin-binding protein 2 [Proteobacteria bacterium]|nr:penicillin-binding protein 2 [Pseudomonadota bacterium]